MIDPEFTSFLTQSAESFELAPPIRFNHATFDSFICDASIAGQEAAVGQVQAFAAQKPRKRWFCLAAARGKGLYLDGGFGVGKTHLLASSWREATGSKKYCSFAEAISLAVQNGADKAIEILQADLVCIDEFELDDPSNTRLADLLVDGLIRGGAKIMVTSNTIPGELGQGRLFVDQFRSQLVRIAENFSDVHVPGSDYRQKNKEKTDGQPRRWRQDASAPEVAHSLRVSMPELDGLLQNVPVIHLRRVGQRIRHLIIDDLDVFTDQLPALRFVHLIDRCYDARVTLTVPTTCPLNDIFHPDYRDWSFAKKYYRCLSRLFELTNEDPYEHFS